MSINQNIHQPHLSYVDDDVEEHYVPGEGWPLPPMQDLINSGLAWKLEGHIGRSCMDCIESGECVLGEVGHRDYYGNYVPSRHEVLAGTKGSIEYAERKQEEK